VLVRINRRGIAVSDHVYCSEQAAAEPMAGTADRVDVWVLLEYRPAWKGRALEESQLAPAVRAWLERSVAALASAGLKARPQLIRQPEIDSNRVRLLVGVAECLLEFSGEGYDFLLDLDLAAVVDNPFSHRRLEEPHYFVCTNGQRDLCCARFGLPAYAALRERVGSRAWQVTHLGGHRFAPNVLVLPQGVLYGRVDGNALEDFVAGVEAGRLCFPLLRGRSVYPPPAQAAEAFSGRSDLRLRSVTVDGAVAQVIFDGPEGPVEVAVRRGEPVMVLKSCDAAPEPAHPYLRHR
jgi:hypothetical protein